MVHAFQLDPRTDEVVPDLAADGPTGIHDVALIQQQPIEAALGADVEARVRRIRRLEPGRRSAERAPLRSEMPLFHDQSPLDRVKWSTNEVETGRVAGEV